MSVIANIQVLPLDILSEFSKYCYRAIIATYIAWIYCVPLYATTAVAIVDREAIIVGTDSLWRGSRSGTALKCKISIEKNNCTYVIVGLRTKPETGFNSSMFASRACRDASSIRKAAIAFGDSVRAELKRALNYSRLHDSIVYKRDYRGKAPLEVLFMGFELDKPIVAVKSFELDNRDRLNERITYIPDANDGNIALSGEHEAANAFVNSHPTWPIRDSPSLARTLVEIEIKDKPDHVGGPVDVLIIKRTSHRWIAPYGTCNKP